MKPVTKIGQVEKSSVYGALFFVENDSCALEIFVVIYTGCMIVYNYPILESENQACGEFRFDRSVCCVIQYIINQMSEQGTAH